MAFITFLLGILVDVLVVLYYRAITSKAVLLASIISFVITVIPFVIVELGIFKKKRILVLTYAIGAGVGTGIGILLKLFGLN